jgi:hypothetical protein
VSCFWREVGSVGQRVAGRTKIRSHSGKGPNWSKRNLLEVILWTISVWGW